MSARILRYCKMVIVLQNYKGVKTTKRNQMEQIMILKRK